MAATPAGVSHLSSVFGFFLFLYLGGFDGGLKIDQESEVSQKLDIRCVVYISVLVVVRIVPAIDKQFTCIFIYQIFWR